MADFTLPLTRVGPRQQALVGGKGAGLGALIEAGFPVPDGFVVTTAAYRDFLDATGLAGRPGPELHERIPQEAVPERIASAVLGAYAELGSPAVAVRSSGTAEDLAGASFAGQHDTYLGVVGGQAILDAVRDCWASLWTPRVIAYRERYHWDEHDLALAVVVQTMVDAQWAGVMFTADPVSGRRDQVVIEAVRGLGDELVSGEVTGEHVVVDKASARRVSGEVSLPRLDDLVRLGRAVEEAFGSPQDIEWAFADGRFQLVQARPLTALPDPPADGAGSPSKRRPRNYGPAADHMPFPPFPMDNSLFVRRSLGSILNAFRTAGFAVPTLDETVVEIADGVVQVVPPQLRPTWRAALGVPIAIPKVVKLLRTSPDSWRARSDASLVPLARQIDAADLSALSERDLVWRVEELMEAVSALMPSRFGAVPGRTIAGVLAKPLLTLSVGRARAGRLHDELMSGVPCVTTDANAELDRIAAIVRYTPELLAIYRSEEPAGVSARLRTSAAGQALLQRIDAYLTEYGFREMSIFTVGLPPLRETPEVVHGLIMALIRRAPEGSRSGGPDRAMVELFEPPGVRTRLLGPLIRRLVAAGRTAAGFREDSHYQIVMALAVIRRVVLELGRRLVERAALDSADDIAYLELSEAVTLAPDAAREVVARRKAARRAALPGYTIIPAELMTSPDDTDGVRGTPASRGTAAGPVRVIRDESQFKDLQPGDVLVCPYTNPTWTPLFSMAAAVVVDTGGAASHAAIVAREHGIPAVMGTGNGTRMLQDGQRVVVNGATGTVVVAGGVGG